MAGKEERILIDIIENGLNCVYRMDNDPKGLSLCKHNGEEEPVSEKDCKNCLEGITRQEAIERMAKAIFSKCYDYKYKWEVANEETKTVFRLYTREALNALLEGV